MAFEGLVLGIFAVLCASSLLASILFGMKQADPLAFWAVSVVLMFSAFLASYVPARRAMTLDPIVALRDE